MFIVLKVLGDLARQIGPWVMSVGMVIGPVSPYIPQYLETRRSGVAGGFSPLVAFLLVISSIGRIFYWILLRFDTTLLWQAILMIIVQLLLLKQQVALFAASGRRASVWDFTLRHFWQWTSFSDYLCVLTTITFLLSAIVYMLRGHSFLGSAIGSVSLFAESSISVPQFVANCRRGTTVGLSAIMIAMWFSGDVYKLVYFTLVPVPSAFMVCAVIQSWVDFLISCQIVRTKCRQAGRCQGSTAGHHRITANDSSSDDEGSACTPTKGGVRNPMDLEGGPAPPTQRQFELATIRKPAFSDGECSDGSDAPGGVIATRRQPSESFDHPANGVDAEHATLLQPSDDEVATMTVGGVGHGTRAVPVRGKSGVSPPRLHGSPAIARNRARTSSSTGGDVGGVLVLSDSNAGEVSASPSGNARLLKKQQRKQ